ncbi:MAG: alpha/beta fold hydrolase [Planctomycetota bacterium]
MSDRSSYLSDEHPPFRPPWFLRHPHVMTWTILWPKPEPGPPSAEPYEVPVQGGKLRGWAHWHESKRPVAVLLHGLTGSAQSTWVRRAAQRYLDAGFHVIRHNARGSDGTARMARPLNHFGLTDDVEALLRQVDADPRTHGIHVCAYSMGANQVLKVAGGWGGEVPIDLRSIVAVGPAVDTPLLARRIDELKGLRIYLRNFLKDLRKMQLEQSDEFGLSFTKEELDACKTMRSFDDLVTAPEWRYANADDYYEEASAFHSVQDLRVPTLVLASEDDFLVPFESLDPLRRVPAIRFLDTTHGGHCAFVNRRGKTIGDPDRYWADHRALEFSREHASMV